MAIVLTFRARLCQWHLLVPEWMQELQICLRLSVCMRVCVCVCVRGTSRGLHCLSSDSFLPCNIIKSRNGCGCGRSKWRNSNLKLRRRIGQCCWVGRAIQLFDETLEWPWISVLWEDCIVFLRILSFLVKSSKAEMDVAAAGRNGETQTWSCAGEAKGQCCWVGRAIQLFDETLEWPWISVVWEDCIVFLPILSFPVISSKAEMDVAAAGGNGETQTWSCAGEAKGQCCWVGRAIQLFDETLEWPWISVLWEDCIVFLRVLSFLVISSKAEMDVAAAGGNGGIQSWSCAGEAKG